MDNYDVVHMEMDSDADDNNNLETGYTIFIIMSRIYLCLSSDVGRHYLANVVNVNLIYDN